jgi:hypothetical protein
MLRILTGLLLGTMLIGQARAADYYKAAPAPPVPGHVYRALPACDEPSVLARISEKFAYQDRHITFTGLAIDRIGDIRERALKTGGPSLTDFRYCSATAWLSNGRTSEVVYLIEGPMKGPFSIGSNVESCLPDFDPYRVYDARCRSIRP